MNSCWRHQVGERASERASASAVSLDSLLHDLCCCCCVQEEQAAKLKAENIRVALEKIKEAQVKKVSPHHTQTRRNNEHVVYLCGTCPADCFLGQVSVTLH